MQHIFLIHLFGWFHTLAIMDIAAMNMDVQGLYGVQTRDFGYAPRTGIVES